MFTIVLVQITCTDIKFSTQRTGVDITHSRFFVDLERRACSAPVAFFVELERRYVPGPFFVDLERFEMEAKSSSDVSSSNMNI